MQVINWLELQPLLADVDMLNARLQESLPVRKVCQVLVDITLRGYPWPGRSDLIPCYHPSRTYQQGQWIALPVPDPQNLHPAAWQVAQVKSAETTGNSIQGRFQALVLDVGGKELQRTGGITGATYPEPALSEYSSEELGWLVEWVADTYTGALLTTLKKLIQKGKLCGQVAGDTFLPEQLFALSMERLHPFFARLSTPKRWLSSEEILQGLPDLSALKRETALGLIRSTLKVSPYRSLGGDRWTTPALFDQMDREITYGLPAAYDRSKSSIWTEQDKKDLAVYRKKSIPAEAACALEELGIKEIRSELDVLAWQPPTGLMRLPALNYHQITQAYFPVGNVIHAFAPGMRMVFVQLIDGDYQPFLLDREQAVLKAINPEALLVQFLDAGIPAGTHLWLEYHGEERYRIFLQPLSSKRWVPCKRALLENATLHIEQIQIQMNYESEPSLFKADMSFEDIESLWLEARNCSLSVQEEIISTIQEICAADLGKQARRSEIFNAVFLKRICSPHAISILLYTEPSFIQLAGNHFRYRPVPDVPAINVWKNTNRVTQLWEDLVANCVAPDPVTRKRTSWRGDSELAQSLPIEVAPDQSIFSSLEPVQVDAEIPVLSTVSASHGGSAFGENTFMEKISIESVNLFKHVFEHFTVLPIEAPAAYPSLDDKSEELPVVHKDLENVERSVPSGRISAYSPTFVKISREPEPQPTSTIDTRRIVYGLKIPTRPLHKRPYYQRLFFSLRSWIHSISRRSHDRTPR